MYEKLAPDALLFEENISKNQVTLAEPEVVVTQNEAEEIKEQALEEEGSEEEEGETPDTIRQGSSEGGISSGSESSGTGTISGTEEEQEIGVTEPEPEETETKKLNKVRLKIDKISTSKIADLNRGVIKPLTREIGQFDMNLEIDIEDKDGVDEEVLEDQVKETIRQIKAEITEEELE